jgi:Domain of unknown function (DUF2382)
VTLPNSEQFEPESVDREPQRPELFSASNLSQAEKAVESDSINASSIVSEATIQLLEERLVVNRHKRKVGEVVIRKEIETRIVEVPIRREKLIVEQVSPENKELLVVDLGEKQETDFKAAEAATVEGRFTSVNAAIQFLQAIADQSSPDLQGINVIVALKDDNSKTTYQRWLDKSLSS